MKALSIFIIACVGLLNYLLYQIKGDRMFEEPILYLISGMFTVLAIVLFTFSDPWDTKTELNILLTTVTTAVIATSVMSYLEYKFGTGNLFFFCMIVVMIFGFLCTLISALEFLVRMKKQWKPIKNKGITIIP